MSSPASSAKLSAEDVSRVRSLLDEWVSATLNRDWDRLAALLTEDAVFLPPEEPMVVGRNSVKAWVDKLLPIKEFKVGIETIEGFGDLAWMRGTWAMTVEPEPGRSFAIVGKSSMTFKRQADGSWLCASDMWNADHAGIRMRGIDRSTQMTKSDRDAVAAAIKGWMDGYAKAMRRQDPARVLSFCADEDGFVIAADGKLATGYGSYADMARQFFGNVREVIEVTPFNGHTYVLGPDAAVHTTEFRWAVVDKGGNIIRAHGSWSYVLRDFGGEWKVIHSAGTHVYDTGTRA